MIPRWSRKPSGYFEMPVSLGHHGISIQVFNGTQNVLASYRKGFNKSGGRDFELEGIDGPGFELFCGKFCNSMKDVMHASYGLVHHQG
jgi:hypothetical protein